MYKPGAHINVVPHKNGSPTLGAGQHVGKCGACHGSGKKINFRIGLGHDSLVPAYTDDKCEVCGGDGVTGYTGDAEHTHYEYDVPDSFLLWLWQKLTG
jgi:DnaJ-class molecular chaperone